MDFLKKEMLFCWICLAIVVAGCGQKTQFKEMRENQTGLVFINKIEETEHNNIMTYEYTYNGAGVAVGDINNDGLTDLYFSGNSVSNKLFLNKGDWKFTDITELSNTAGRDDWKTGVTMVDINGDGWLDIYLCYSGNTPGEGFNKPIVIDQVQRSNQLFINNGCEPGGTPTFTEKSKEYQLDAIGTFSTQSYFLDYDLDGDLDMFLLNHANMFYSVFINAKKLRNLRHPYFGNKLYRNDNNKFIEVSDESGIHGSGLNFGLSAAISDINADNWPDIYVTNDYDEQDFCYINNQDGSFREVSHTIFGHLSKYGMGSDIADINNDGLQDIFVGDMLPEDNYRQKLLKGPDEYDKYSLAVDSGYHHQYMRNTLQLNRGFSEDSLPRFSEIGQIAGISNTDWSWATLFSDFDNDGLKDIFITNGYYRDFTNMDFVKYTVSDAVNEANDNNHPVDMLGLIQKMPSTKINNYIFKNTDGTNFINHSTDWGLEKKTISNGAAYADLDNDGDNDLIVCNLGENVSIYQNQQEKIQQNNYIKLQLKGSSKNTFGLGTKIWITIGDNVLFHETYYTRGYQSSVEPLLTIGLGKATNIKGIKIRWPDGKISLLQDVKPNQKLDILQEKAGLGENLQMASAKKPKLFRDVTEESGMDFEHIENPYVDFKAERLLLYQLSKMGGKLAVADVNQDGNDDVFLNGAAGQAGQLYLGNDDGSFSKGNQEIWIKDNIHEDINSTFFDADADGDLDLYLVSGGNEFSFGNKYYQDRLYLNDGKGNFSKSTNALPSSTTSGSCAAAADFDKDGDLDLFIGGRLVPESYPLTPESHFLKNELQEGNAPQFKDVGKEIFEGIQSLGMVTDAIWSDINGDSWPDLIVIGEWMPVKIFHNEGGKKFKDVTAEYNLEKSNGWWSKITECDIDEDGDMDFLLGNSGTNIQLQASTEKPITCYVQDINEDGKVDPILCYFVQDKSYPLPSRDELLEQVIPLRKKFIKYADYADATIETIVKEDLLKKSHILKAYTLESAFLENEGNGKFSIKPLPEMAQISMVNGFIQEDFDGDGDGKQEILAAGNFYPYRVQLGRSDAAQGILMKFQEGKAFQYLSQTLLPMRGDVRDLAVLKFNKANKKLIVTRNSDKASIYEWN